MLSHTPNIHNNNTDPGGKIISTVDTTGAVFLHPSSSIPTTVTKKSTGQVTSVRGVVPGTTIIFENVLEK